LPEPALRDLSAWTGAGRVPPSDLRFDRLYFQAVFQGRSSDHETGSRIAEGGAQDAPASRRLKVECQHPLTIERQNAVQPSRKRLSKTRIRRALLGDSALYLPNADHAEESSVVRCRSNHATTAGSRSRLRRSDSMTVSIRNIRGQDRAAARHRAGILVILRDGE